MVISIIDHLILKFWKSKGLGHGDVNVNYLAQHVVVKE